MTSAIDTAKARDTASIIDAVNQIDSSYQFNPNNEALAAALITTLASAYPVPDSLDGIAPFIELAVRRSKARFYNGAPTGLLFKRRDTTPATILDLSNILSSTIELRYRVYTNCYRKWATTEAVLDRATPALSAQWYRHFNGNSTLSQTDATTLTSGSGSFGRTRLSFADDELLYTRVSDPCGSATHSVSALEYWVYNDAPTILVTQALAFDVGAQRTHRTTIDPTWFGDAENDPLTFRLVDAPDFATLIEDVIVITPSATDAGQHTLALVANDGYDDALPLTITLNVNANQLPVLNETTPLRGTQDTAFAHVLNPSDAEGDSITLKPVNLPTWLNFDPEQNALSGTPNGRQTDTYQLEFELSDGLGQSSQALTLEIDDIINPVEQLVLDAASGIPNETWIEGVSKLRPTASERYANARFIEILRQTVNNASPVPVLTTELDALIEAANVSFLRITPAESENIASLIEDLQTELPPVADANMAAVEAVLAQQMDGESLDVADLVSAIERLNAAIEQVDQAVNQSPEKLVDALANLPLVKSIEPENASAYATVMNDERRLEIPHIQSQIDATNAAVRTLSEQFADDPQTIDFGLADQIGLSTPPPNLERAVRNQLANDEPPRTATDLEAHLTRAIQKALTQPVAHIELYATTTQGRVPVASLGTDQALGELKLQLHNPSAETASVDWSQSDSALLAASVSPLNQTRFYVDLNRLDLGQYLARAVVTRGTFASMVTLAVVVSEQSQIDSDHDGIADAFDTVHNGFTNPVVRNRLSQFKDEPQHYQLQSEAGTALRIGQRARTEAFNQASMTSYLEKYPLPPLADNTDPETLYAFDTHPALDFEIVSLPAAGHSAQIVIPLDQALTAKSTYLKHHPATGWVPFISDHANGLASAAQIAPGVCPDPGSADYVDGLVPGHRCLQLLIEDGGPNDADRLNADGTASFDKGQNGVIVDPGLLIYDLNPVTNSMVDTDAAGNQPSLIVQSAIAGSGSIGWVSLIGLSAVILRRRTQPQRQAKHKNHQTNPY
ncbi:MAG: putative Ig domain-containing protein [Gammaproteobacteria bacterium]|nr:putative Ig domain-containing protein [Gammaproteobacteria bacterium]